MDDGKKGWFDDPRHVEWLFRALCIACAALVVTDLFVAKHGHFRWEGWVAFFAVFGFVSYSFIVLAGRLWRRVVKRDEEYYDR